MADLDDDELDDILDSALEEFEQDEEEKIEKKEKEKEKEKEEKEKREREAKEKGEGKKERDESDDILDEELKEQFESFQKEFQDSLKQLAESCQNGEAPQGLPGLDGGEMPSEEDLQKLIEGIGEGFGDEEFDKLLSKDVLYEPMVDLASKYQEWIEKNQEADPEEMERAKKQLGCLEEICSVLKEKEGDASSDKVQELLEKMEEFGAPPQGIYESCLPSLGGEGGGQGEERGEGGEGGEGVPPEFEQMMKALMAGGGEGGEGMPEGMPKDCVIC